MYENERWASCHENYEVSDHGRVRHKINKKIRKLMQTYRGYLTVSMQSPDGSRKNKYPAVARLVATAFIPNPDSAPVVNHIDGDKLNNHHSNLEWCTHSHNTQHAIKTGLRPPSIGFKNPKTTVTREQAEEIRRKMVPYSHTLGVSALARQMGISQQNANNALKYLEGRSADGRVYPESKVVAEKPAGVG